MGSGEGGGGDGGGVVMEVVRTVHVRACMYMYTCTYLFIFLPQRVQKSK